MNDKPEAVAWLYEIPGTNIRYAYAQRRDCFAEGWTETPLYPEPPAQPDASALVEAAAGAMLVLDGFTMMGIEATKRTEALRAALTAWEAQHG